jgi:hypothetical protein
MLTVRLIPLVLILIAVVSVLIAALVPVSKAKGQARLLASLFVGAGFGLDSLLQLTRENEVWPRLFELMAGALLVWLGFRKHRRDPEGRTPAASIL